jgi:molybdopterin converting factor subunit 1
MARIKIILFAALADRVGARELPLELPERASVGDAVAALAAEHPAIEAMRGKLAAAVNLSYVGLDEPLRDGDELALIPPVSGG